MKEGAAPRRRTSIFKESTKLREALKERWKRLGLSQQAVADDANKKGLNGIHRQGISKYLTNPYASGALSDYHITWLAFRYDIPITLGIGYPEPMGVKYKVTNQFNETRALKILKLTFPETILEEVAPTQLDDTQGTDPG